MSLKSNLPAQAGRIHHLILFITSLLCSRAMFSLFNDPEGPNLLIVVVMALIIYFLSLTIYLFKPLHLSFTGIKRLLLTVFIQIIIATVFYFGLN